MSADQPCIECSPYRAQQESNSNLNLAVGQSPLSTHPTSIATELTCRGYEDWEKARYAHFGCARSILCCVADCIVHLQFATSVIDGSEFRMHEHRCEHAREAHHSFVLLGWRMSDRLVLDERHAVQEVDTTSTDCHRISDYQSSTTEQELLHHPHLSSEQERICKS